jgi:beta-carotene hydroxylase
MPNQYLINQLLLAVCAVSYIAIFTTSMFLEFSTTTSVFAWVISIVCLHYLLNLVHIASHNILARSPKLNSVLGGVAAFFGGVTIADFKSTHLLHHRFLDDPKRDPDHYITNSGWWVTIPFKIFYHDVYFWREGLWRKNSAWKSYILTRILQISLITIIILSGYKSVWIALWLTPMLVLGLLNGLFLFYLPHYIPKLEQKWRTKPTKFNKLPLVLIDISRVSHERHHDNIRNNENYFPLFSFMKSVFSKSTTLSEATQPDFHLKYTKYT